MNGPLAGGTGGGSRAFALTYLVLQAGAVTVYWFGLVLLPEFRSTFTMSGSPPGAIWSLIPAEAALVIVSLLSAFGVYKRTSWASSALWMLAGMSVYASLYAIGLAIVDPRLWPGAGLMLPVLVVPLALARATRHQALRPSSGQASCVVRTAVQTLLFWAFFLLVVPVLLKRAEVALDVAFTQMHSEVVRLSGVVVFAAAGVTGLWSGWTIATVGRGTPLPLDPAQRLVIAGPYRFVRNPMAITGVLQGVGVGLWLGSWLVVAYSLCGALLWHTVVRPQEERELNERFGPTYEAYRCSARCWLPRVRPLPRC